MTKTASESNDNLVALAEWPCQKYQIEREVEAADVGKPDDDLTRSAT